MKKIALICAVIFLLMAGWLLKYYNGRDYKLYNEARELAAKGDIYGAHDKISEALEINPKNRKVISYKTELYFLVKNDSAIKDAQKGKSDAERAMEKGDYALAAQRLDAALAAVDNVSTLYDGYHKAEKLQKELIKDVERVIREAPEKYYLRGMELYQRGEYERAYNMLGYISDPTPKVVKLMDEIAYKIGGDEYAKAVRGSGGDAFLVRSAISWLEKVSEGSPDSIEAKARVSKLKKYLKN